MKKVCGFAPASIGNFCVGFDVLGLALESIGDKVEVSLNGTDTNRITQIVNGENLPMSIDKNCCSVVIRKMQEALGNFRGLDIRIHKGFESGSGLGSSSASSAAAAFTYNEFLGKSFRDNELVAFAAEGERLASGTAHADNVAPALLGGLVLVRDNNPIDIIRLPIPKGLFVVILFPKIVVNTKDSRSVMQQNISLQTATNQWANMGALVASLYQNDLSLLSRAMVDEVAEPARALLIPKFEEIKAAAKQNDAISFGISGSGPSVFALTDNITQAKKIQEAMKQVFYNTSIDTMSLIESLANNKGARLVDTF